MFGPIKYRCDESALSMDVRYSSNYHSSDVGALSLAAINWRVFSYEFALKAISSGVLILITSGCAPSVILIKEGVCADDGATLLQYATDDCMREVCVNNKIVSVEDLTETAMVDDFAEEKFCLFHPINCYKAYTIKNKLLQWEQDMAGLYWDRKSLQNGLGDAARHAYMTCMLAEELGVDFARRLGDVHEKDSGYMLFSSKGGTGNPCCEKVMDTHNNEVGLMLSGMTGTCGEKVLNSLHLLRHSLCQETKEE